jgi:hypothetical protein
VSDESWDAALYTTLDRAATLSRFMAAFEPGYEIDSPALSVLPTGQLGAAFEAANRAHCRSGVGGSATAWTPAWHSRSIRAVHG